MARAGVVNGTCWHRQWFVLLMDKSSDPVYWAPIYHRRLLGVICPDQPATACPASSARGGARGDRPPLAGERARACRSRHTASTATVLIRMVAALAIRTPLY